MKVTIVQSGTMFSKVVKDRLLINEILYMYGFHIKRNKMLLFKLVFLKYINTFETCSIIVSLQNIVQNYYWSYTYYYNVFYWIFWHLFTVGQCNTTTCTGNRYCESSDNSCRGKYTFLCQLIKVYKWFL